jgi:hypothetical protein
MSANIPSDERPVDQWFLFALVSLLLGFTLALLAILLWRYDDAHDVASIAGVALSPASSIVGGIFGHHVGSRRRG